jgi:hypothetical protein
MADLETLDARAAHAFALARHYGLAPHSVEVRATYPREPGAERTGVVTWIDSTANLLKARLVSRAQVGALLELLQQSHGPHTGVQWIDAAGTRWTLSPNGGARGDEFGLWLTASYPNEAEELAARAESPEFTREVEGMVRKATGLPIRFADLRAAKTD